MNKTTLKISAARMEKLFRPDPSLPSHEEKFRKDRLKWPSLICEGDSWFRNPGRFVTIPQHLNQDKLGYSSKLAILNRASPGDTAEGILHGLGRAYEDVRKYRPNGFLLSAGGNDLLNPSNLRSIIKPRTGNGDFFNEEKMTAFEQELGQTYIDILATLNSAQPGMPIFLHGYDYPHVTGRGIGFGPIMIGPWLKPVIETERGYRLKSEQQALVRQTIQRLEGVQKNAMSILTEWCKKKGVRCSLHHVNLKGTVPSADDWLDEIHPSSTSNKKLATKIKAAVMSVIS